MTGQLAANLTPQEEREPRRRRLFGTGAGQLGRLDQGLEVLDDLRAADEITRQFERCYWLSSADFYELYSQGLLDNGEHTEDFALCVDRRLHRT